jgi:putative addiction module killer protein
MYEILEYVMADGKKPFAEWLLSLRDKKARAKIRSRITRASLGNFGDWKSLAGGGGICEMREHFGVGYRIFYKLAGRKIILLLAGATKPEQDRMIAKAKEYLANYERRTK